MPKKPQFGSIYQRGALWWIKYYRDGKPFYESSESAKYTDAQHLLAQRRAEIVNGTHLESKARRLLVNELLDTLVRDYKINGKDFEWCERVTRKHLRPFFGELRAAKLQHDFGEKYIEHRQSEGAANATPSTGKSPCFADHSIWRDARESSGLSRCCPASLQRTTSARAFLNAMTS